MPTAEGEGEDQPDIVQVFGSGGGGGGAGGSGERRRYRRHPREEREEKLLSLSCRGGDSHSTPTGAGRAGREGE